MFEHAMRKLNISHRAYTTGEGITYPINEWKI